MQTVPRRSEYVLGVAIADQRSGKRLAQRLVHHGPAPTLPLQPYNHDLQLGNDRPMLHDDGDENIATGGGPVALSIHSLDIA